MRVAIVNDLALATEALRRLLKEMPDIQIAWTARDGAQAVAAAAADRPDLILMDMVMPVMDGAEATRQIMQHSPCAIVVVTASVGANADRVFDALSNGALDATETPAVGIATDPARDMLRRKIEQVRRLQLADPRADTSNAVPTPASARPCPPLPDGATAHGLLVGLLGSSTGGPQALAEVLASLPRDFPFALVVVQHLDPSFVPGLVTWLARETGRTVVVAECGATARASTMSIADGQQHLLLTPGARFAATHEPAHSIHRPSVDVLFRSAIPAALQPFGAALLTGMGRDGAEGLLALRRAGWRTMAQDRATSVVWGMPGAAEKLLAAETTLPLAEIGPAFMRLAAEAAPRR